MLYLSKCGILVICSFLLYTKALNRSLFNLSDPILEEIDIFLSPMLGCFSVTPGVLHSVSLDSLSAYNAREYMIFCTELQALAL